MSQRNNWGVIDTSGIEFNTNEHRGRAPRRLSWVSIGAQPCFLAAAFCCLALTYGFGWRTTVTAIVAGLILRSLIRAPLPLLRPRTAGSRARRGADGRVISSIFALIAVVGFFALSVWTVATHTAGWRTSPARHAHQRHGRIRLHATRFPS